MAYDLLITATAKKQMRGLVEYIAVELSNPQAAARLANALDDVFIRLEENPYAFPLCHDWLLQQSGYRLIALKNVVVLFRIKEEGDAVKQIIVSYVFHGKQDYPNLIKD